VQSQFITGELSRFNQPLAAGVLPASLIHHLQFGYYFRQPIDVSLLPASLTYLKVDDNYPYDLNVNEAT
jgi:hypothetical protein